jgi:hypothetical protein
MLAVVQEQLMEEACNTALEKRECARQIHLWKKVCKLRFTEYAITVNDEPKI